MPNLPSETLRLADLSSQKPTEFDLSPSASERDALAQALNLPKIKKLSFSGHIAPHGKNDWRLDAKLGASVTQTCVATLEPMATRIDEDITRTYLAEMPDIDGLEVEIPEDDSIEELPVHIDLYQVALEALALALPPFPRADDTATVQLSVTEPGIEPLTDETAKPFAGLEKLKKTLEKKQD